MGDIKLKPCPFCGGKAEYIINSNYERCTTHGWQFGIKCTNCMIELPARDFIVTADLESNGEIAFAKDDRKKAADVEPVRHGQWEGYTHSRYCGIDEYGEPIFRDGIVYYCSNPKCRRKTVIKENYCPSCGAKMDLEGETNDD